jgi:hypothetical protein
MAKENAEVTENKTVEYTPIVVEVHPEHTGAKVASVKRCKDNATSFECMLAIPSNDADAQALYACDMNEIIKAGVRQMGYGDHVWESRKTKDGKKLGLKEQALKDGEDMFGKSFLNKLAKAMREDMARPKVREASGGGIKAKAAKQEAELREIYSQHGLVYGQHTIADLQAAMMKKLSGKK